MIFVPEEEAKKFDTQVTAFWSQLTQRDAISPLFFLPLKLGGLGVGSAVQRHAASPWNAWQSVIPINMATSQSPDTDTLFTPAPRLRAQLVTTNDQASLPPNHLARHFAKKPHKRSESPPSNGASHKQLLESLTTSPVDRAVVLSQSAPHTGAHLMQPSSEAYEAEDRCFRVAVARRLMLPHPAAANPSDVARTCPDKNAAG